MELEVVSSIVVDEAHVSEKLNNLSEIIKEVASQNSVKRKSDVGNVVDGARSTMYLIWGWMDRRGVVCK